LGGKRPGKEGFTKKLQETPKKLEGKICRKISQIIFRAEKKGGVN